MSTKIITIIGATGTQGGSVISALLSSPSRSPYHLRAVTRNPDSPKARTLASQGVELVTADLDNKASLLNVFQGSQIIFGVTDWATLFKKHGVEEATRIEIQQGTNLYLAAKETKTLEHYIWSTVSSPDKVSGGKWKVPFLDSKSVVDDLIKKDKEFLAKTTFFWCTVYGTNMGYPVTKPREEEGIWVLRLPVGPGAVIEEINDPSKNVGIFVKAIIEQPDKTRNGIYVLGSVESITTGDMLKLWGEVLGRETRYEQITQEAYEEMHGKFAGLTGRKFGFYEEFGREGLSWSAGKGDKVLKKGDLGIKDEDLVGLKGCYEGMNWD
ncbi:related to nitrogen metabolic regulation protein nmr [Phialocephala subalpina]|uniref:Related to nitrogen metabolic regulation protein nmr n=1 Tax=Phialocephala subalpina TaxID=576137 RepID=A0A1L7WVM9_9HELO|nr:related to nitrogen metabolic regulation protein nmr [Phialocephala subalpina]